MRVGLFLSRDDGTISEVVDVEALARDCGAFSVTRVYDNYFGRAALEDMIRTVGENDLDGLVVAGNSPTYYDEALGGSLLVHTLNECGINENRIAFVNIREQVAFPHRAQPKEATRKARLLIDAALAKVELSQIAKSTTVSPRKAVLVIGTTAGGLVAASEFLAKGYRVYIIDRATSLSVPQELKPDLLPTLTAIEMNKRASLLLGADIKDVAGYCGQYRVVLTVGSSDQEIGVGGMILSAGDDTKWISSLRSKLRFSVDREGFVRQEARQPGRTPDPGVWFVPSFSNGDRLVSELTSASLAVLSLSSILDKDEIQHPLLITEVDATVCGGCGTCVKTCAFSASKIDVTRRLSSIDPERCKGCGNCVTACPTGARDLVTLPRMYVNKAIGILGQRERGEVEPRILAIMCKNCGNLAMDMAGAAARDNPASRYPATVMPLLVECGGSVDTQYVLEAFSKGFDAVALFICQDGNCHNIVGNTDMQRRLSLFRAVLRSRHIDDARLRVVPVHCDEGSLVVEEINAILGDLEILASDRGGR